MAKLRQLLVVLLALLAGMGLAQSEPTVQGRLADVRVEGTTTYADIVRTIITARRNTPVESIDLEAERNRVYSLGTFEEVTVSLEQGATGPVLVIKVKENPLVGDVAFEGVSAVPKTDLADALKTGNLVEPGRVYNTSRSDEGKRTIQQAYRAAGFPFDVDVNLTVKPAPDLAQQGQRVPVRLTYTVDESATVDKIVFEGETVFDAAKLKGPFLPLERAGTFGVTSYRTAVQDVAKLYADAGYRGSGVDLQSTELTGGTLTVRISELTIASIDTTALGVDPSDLSLHPGDLFNYDTLLTDVKRLAKGRSSDIQLQTLRSATGAIRVVFHLGAPETAGPIDAIRFEGNTVFTDDELQAMLELHVGDTFTSAVAREDFDRIARAYSDKGYLLRNEPDFSYDAGTYVQRVTELKIAAYEVQFQGPPDATKPFVITRYLPPVGSVVNIKQIDNGLLKVYRTGAITPVGRTLKPTDVPDEMTVVVVVEHVTTGTFQPALQYATDTGFSASVSYDEKNFLGRAHTVGAQADLSTTDLGLMLGGSLRYSIPWLYIPGYDFETVPTSISASIFSNVQNNQPLDDSGRTTTTYPGLADTDANQVRLGEFTVRNTGLSLSVGRVIFPNTTLSLGASGSYAEYKLEPPVSDCKIKDGKVTNGATCALPSNFAVAYLPTSGLSSFLSSRVQFDDRDSSDFPTTGILAYGSLGVGFGNDFNSPTKGVGAPYVYEQITGGIRTYARLSDLDPQEVTDPNHVFAVRLDAGHQFGDEYPSTKEFLVGRTTETQTQLRGYAIGDFNLSRSYVTSSFEYRYDFGLDTVATQTVIGIAFVDAGWASSVPGFTDYETPIFLSAGVGVQINLGFGSVLLPAIRLDYAFSQRHPTGVFGFRVGPVF